MCRTKDNESSWVDSCHGRLEDTFVFDNLNRDDYLALLKNCLAIVGNSSSGLLEAPTFKTPAVNIGRRQNNRLQGKNVINCEYDFHKLKEAIKVAISKSFKISISDCVNPYGEGNSAQKILKTLMNTEINDKLLIKNLTY